jgi:hypothetical protein
MEHCNLQTGIVLGLLSLFILLNIIRARRGVQLFIRRLPGVAHIEEAVGRATEMGRPVLFCSGLGGVDVLTLQALAVLAHVVRIAARLRNRVIVPVFGGDPTLFPVTQQVVREAYASGRPELYDESDIRFLSDQQFAYAASVVGIMSREKVATNFFFGDYAAESLLLAESGQHVGAVQIAGTPTTDQVPFFLATCDYTIIGEEYYATSAYITREPTHLGSLIGQDWGKILLGLLIVVGLAWAVIHGVPNWFSALWDPYAGGPRP